MKTRSFLLFLTAFSLTITSCSLFSKAKYGCPSNGKNVGAERLLTGEKLPKAKKFNS